MRKACDKGIIDGMAAQTGYDALMQEVCVGWGFCGCVKRGTPLHVSLIIPPGGPVTADQFVDWVFLADNLNPNSQPERWRRHKDAIRAAFVHHMGSEVVDARQLRWSDLPPEDEPDHKYRELIVGEEPAETAPANDA